MNDTEQGLGSDGSHSSPEIPAEALLARIRSVLAERRSQGRNVLPPQALEPLAAEEVEALEYFPWRRLIASRDVLNAADLIDCSRDVFVRRCYRLLLRRNPYASEQASMERWLNRGWDRVVLIAKLRWSEEGRRAGVPMRSCKRRLPAALSRSLRRRARLQPREAP